MSAGDRPSLLLLPGKRQMPSRLFIPFHCLPLKYILIYLFLGTIAYLTFILSSRLISARPQLRMCVVMLVGGAGMPFHRAILPS